MPDRLEESVAKFIRRQGLFAGAGSGPPNATCRVWEPRILLAVSGGADSIALLHILVALRAQGRIDAGLVCAHVNHQLRGPASDADQQFVIEQADRLGVPVAVRAVEVRAYAQTQGLSLETAARQLRLTSLGEVAREYRCEWVCTGHQKNDNAETVLHRLLRGTGFRGLAGIRPMRWVGGLRLASPLLCATRREITQYLEARHLRWCEDQTNVDTVYTRNYIRHRLLPFLQQEAQGCLVDELSELAASAQKLHDRVEREAEEAWSRLIEPGAGRIAIQATELAGLCELVAVELLRRMLVSMGVGEGDLTQAHYRSILQLTRADAGGRSVALPGGCLARREGERMVLSTVGPTGGASLAAPSLAPMDLQVPGKIRFAGREIEARILPPGKIDTARIGAGKSRFVEYLDLDRVKLPLIVRTRRLGDRFQPLGMRSEKKVGKFLTTAKVPRDLREQVLIFADRERIVWVCPIRISEQVKVRENTRRILQLTIRRV
jgi:tRNA(Ile)-lysidine synthase